MGKNITFTPSLTSSNGDNSLQAKKVYIAEELLNSDAAADDLLLLDYAIIEL